VTPPRLDSRHVRDKSIKGESKTNCDAVACGAQRTEQRLRRQENNALGLEVRVADLEG
jgi:hypothetical protein